MTNNCRLKYGLNPHQNAARIIEGPQGFPFKVLNGSPGYINFMDALNAYQLVKELRSSTKMPAATSFKHVSPAGAAVGTPVTEEDRASFFVPAYKDYNPLSCAYLKARNTDPVSSFGDFIALSDIVDIETACLIKAEVSDGIIAPGYENGALEILRSKRNGKYVVLQMDPGYEPPLLENRDIFGITFEQERNHLEINRSILKTIVTGENDLPDYVVRDSILSMIALKYTQSNSVCFSYNGQTIGIGAGQQSRIHCTRIAANKAELWMLRRHPRILDIKFSKELSRTQRYNTVDMCLNYAQLSAFEKSYLSELIDGEIPVLSERERKEWIDGYKNIIYASDAFVPFRDNIDRAAAAGAKYVIQSGGSIRDEDIIKAAGELGITMVFTGLRLFTH